MLAKVASSPLPKRKVLRELGIPKSTYYRWLRRKDQQRLEDDAGGGKPVWNRLTFQEVRYVLSAARQLPELSCRQLAAWITDNQGFSVSESTVYRILRREGLVKSPEMQLAAGKEFHRKTTRPHQMWATDASYFRVVGWGYYYMVTVMDDYSRFIIAYKLQRDMTSEGRRCRSRGQLWQARYPDKQCWDISETPGDGRTNRGLGPDYGSQRKRGVPGHKVCDSGDEECGRGIDSQHILDSRHPGAAIGIAGLQRVQRSGACVHQVSGRTFCGRWDQVQLNPSRTH